ncbi:hypothetical protein A2635_00275 [Candidatus Peribacteria bacterium RIFCSPHIGHO2_01_FULL_51_9]|nr:MAG: hypothetical protein A2635_00275 [Candidatus Peribacteria bacterium RIFCSPHIGHO2_01_FULL_51_9]
MEIFLLPLLCSEMMLKSSFFSMKLRGMKLMASFNFKDRIFLVNHLMKDDPFNEIAGHKLTIERWVDANKFIFNETTAHYDSFMTTFAAPLAAATPLNRRYNLIVKVTAIKLVKDFLEIVDVAASLVDNPRHGAL